MNVSGVIFFPLSSQRNKQAKKQKTPDLRLQGGYIYVSALLGLE